VVDVFVKFVKNLILYNFANWSCFTNLAKLIFENHQDCSFLSWSKLSGKLISNFSYIPSSQACLSASRPRSAMPRVDSTRHLAATRRCPFVAVRPQPNTNRPCLGLRSHSAHPPTHSRSLRMLLGGIAFPFGNRPVSAGFRSASRWKNGKPSENTEKPPENHRKPPESRFRWLREIAFRRKVKFFAQSLVSYAARHHCHRPSSASHTVGFILFFSVHPSPHIMSVTP